MSRHLATPHLSPLRPGTALDDIARDALSAIEEARAYLAEIASDPSVLKGNAVLIVEGSPLLPYLMARKGARVFVATRSTHYASFLRACARNRRVEEAVTVVDGPFDRATPEGPFAQVVGSDALYTPALEETVEGLVAICSGELHLFWPESAPPQIRFLAGLWPAIHGAQYVDPPYAELLISALEALGHRYTVTYTDVEEPAIYPTLGDAVADCAARMGGIDSRGEALLRRSLRTALTMQKEGLRFRGTYRRAHIVIPIPGDVRSGE
jgi:pentatricopeptide repeat protein